MTRCQDTVTRLYSFLDRELSEEELDEIRHHLHACPGCLDIFRFEERLRRLVRVQGTAQQAPSSLLQAVRARLRGGRPPAG